MKETKSKSNNKTDNQDNSLISPVSKRVFPNGEAVSNCSYIPRYDNVLVRFAAKVNGAEVYLSNSDKFTFKDITIAGYGENVTGLKLGDRIHISSNAIREAALIPENKNRFNLHKKALEAKRDLMCVGKTVNFLPELVKEYGVKTFPEWVATLSLEVVIYQNVRAANIIGVYDNDDILEYNMD